MKKISFLPQHVAENITPSQDMVLISITQLGDSAKLHPNWKSVLRLEFDDADGRPTPGVLRFSPAMAKEVIDFLDKNKDVDELIVHCLAGISRSSAIAKFAAEKYNCNDFLRRFENYDLYNKWVYQNLKELDNPDYNSYN